MLYYSANAQMSIVNYINNLDLLNIALFRKVIQLFTK